MRAPDFFALRMDSPSFHGPSRRPAMLPGLTLHAVRPIDFACVRGTSRPCSSRAAVVRYPPGARVLVLAALAACRDGSGTPGAGPAPDAGVAAQGASVAPTASAASAASASSLDAGVADAAAADAAARGRRQLRTRAAPDAAAPDAAALGAGCTLRRGPPRSRSVGRRCSGLPDEAERADFRVIFNRDGVAQHVAPSFGGLTAPGSPAARGGRARRRGWQRRSSARLVAGVRGGLPVRVLHGSRRHDPEDPARRRRGAAHRRRAPRHGDLRRRAARRAHAARLSLGSEDERGRP